MALSPLASIFKNTMRQQATVYKYGGADEYGQPVYGPGRSYPCRVDLKTERTMNEAGDWISNSTVAIILPADAEAGAYDKIDLPRPYDQGAIIREVTTGSDILGRVTHLEVRIA